MDIRFGTWNVRSMYVAGSLRVVGEELSKYKLDLVGVQEVRELGGACSTNGGEEECIQDIGGKARKKETTGKTKT
jgi:hypothetical protein